MATTTRKSTKAKTSKKPSTKAAKTTKKTASVKAVKTNRPKSPNKTELLDQIKQLNIFSAFVSVGLAVVAGMFMGNASFQLFTSMLTKDELASRATTIFVPAIHAIYDIEMRWFVVATMLVSAILPVLYISKLRKQYESGVKNRQNFWRWLEIAVVSTLVFTGLALVSGVQDIMTLKLLGSLILVTCALGWFAESQNANSAKPIWNSYVLSLVTGILPWLVIAGYALGTYIFGMVRSPWFVYALYGTTLVSFVRYSLNQFKLLKGKRDYLVAERNYVQITLFAKITFAIILIIGLQK